MRSSMPSWRNRLGLLVALVILAGCGGAAESNARPTITGAWVRTPTPGATSTAAYLVISNRGAVAETLTNVATPAATAASMHRTLTSADMGGMTGMQMVDAIHIPAGGEVTLEPGGFHVMLEGLTGALNDGDSVELVLTFEQAGDVTVTAEVRGGLDGRSNLVPGSGTEPR